MDKPKFESPNLTEENIDKIASLFPNVITESRDEDGKLRRAVNFDLLRTVLGDDVAGDEAYEFTWVGKKEAVMEAGRPIRKTLRPCVEESKNWDTTENMYIEGDNLDVLKLLQESYLGKIKMVYIDPPYNTGNDFVYRDNFMQSKDEFEEDAGVYDEDGDRLFRNTESNGRFHSDWCSMMYPRLVLARNLLQDDGVIFISIDENEMPQLHKICDEIFGEANFVARISLLCNPKGRSQDKYVATCHEYILCYSKSVLPKGAVSTPKTKADVEKDYPLKDIHGSYRELELRNTHRDFGKHNRPNLYYPIYVNSSGEISIKPVDKSIEIYPNWDDGFAGCWTWGKDKAKKYKDLLVAKKVKDQLKIYRKAYSNDEGEVVKKQLKSIWTDKNFYTEKGQVAFNQLFNTKGKIFQSPKSVKLLEEIIKMSQASNDDIVLDFFSGSSTTAHAVMQLNAEEGVNRRFIMVQLAEKTDENSDAYQAGYPNICEIGKERIRRAGDKIKEENKDKEGIENLDIGFRVLKLDDSNMEDVYYAAGEITQDLLSRTESNIKDGRTDIDLLYGCLLDWGLPLSMPHTQEEIGGVAIHTYNNGDLIACFADRVSEAVVKEIASRKPLRAVFRDSSFASSPEKINVEEIFKLMAPNTAVKVL